jgi:regulator of PEP synthase PpsR (kinase-PPPase family)
MIRAALVQYADKEIDMVRCKNIRSETQIEPIVEEAFERKALIVYTVVSPQLRNKIRELSASKGIPSFDLLGPLLGLLDEYFGKTDSSPQAGLLRTVDERYFKRIEAIEYTVKHDDGKTFAELDKADIVLVGISRTSKTPLSIFLSHKGWKVANIPLVLNTALPENLFKIDQRKVVGLIIDIDSLQRIRKNRLEKFGQDSGGEYASLAHITQEIEYAHQIFKQNRRWPVFNVTERALEETATEITRIVGARLGWPDSAIF